MKPRLAVPELLAEDSQAWAVVTFCAEMKHFQLGSRLFAASLYADRRDAEVMLQLTHYDHWERDYTRDRVRSVATAFRLVWRQI